MALTDNWHRIAADRVATWIESAERIERFRAIALQPDSARPTGTVPQREGPPQEAALAMYETLVDQSIFDARLALEAIAIARKAGPH